MTRSAIIIGLGGTGQWVLTWLKRDLMLANNGKVPANIKLLGIDTTAQLAAGAKRVKGSLEEEATVVGGVSLSKDDGEYVYLGGDSHKTAENVAIGKYPHIGKWYHASKWLQTQNPSTFVLDEGAGRIRQFGRMAIFQDVLKTNSSMLWRALRTALTEVKSKATEDLKMEIIITGSFAGGTGSGIFIDTALILRLLAEQNNIPHVMRGFFALPSVFDTAPDAELRARVFAAWRELNRFMVVDPEFPMPRIDYAENDPNFSILPNRRLFDGCYLVDGIRDGKQLTKEPKYGVFPMMAEAISAMIDEKAGKAYTEWIFTNLATKYAVKGNTPMYSTIGTYTIQVPAHFIVEQASHDFAKGVVETLLKPESKSVLFGNDSVFSTDVLQKIAQGNKNLEDPGYSGRERALNLLNQQRTYRNLLASPTLFHSRIGEICDFLKDNQRGKIIDQLARAGAADPNKDRATAGASWLNYFPELPAQDFAEVIKQINKYVSYNVLRQFGDSGKDKAPEAERKRKLKNIPETVRVMFGGYTSSGEEDEMNFGQCGEVLDLCRASQIDLFRNLVKVNLVAMLMGSASDPIAARSGKLGYAWDYFDGLSKELLEFENLMQEVAKERGRLKPENKLLGLDRSAKKAMDRMEGNKFLWIWENPRVLKSERAYLIAQQRLIELRIEEIMHYKVAETVQQMQAITQEAADTLRRWIVSLSTGDANLNLSGAWKDIERSNQELINAHSYDLDSGKVRKIVGDESIPYTTEDIKDALRKWEWDVAFLEIDTGQKLQIQPKVIADDPAVLPMVIQDPFFESVEYRRREVNQANSEKILNLARKRFVRSEEGKDVAVAIKTAYNPVEFVKEIDESLTRPLFEGEPHATPEIKSMFIRVQHDDNDSYFIGDDNGVQANLRKRELLPANQRADNFAIEIVDSENPYKFTIVRTDDLYPYHFYAAWQKCLDAYVTHMNAADDVLLDPYLMQNFAAEETAVKYEKRLMKESGHNFHPLHPRVVMLLEDEKALRQFIYLALLGFITQKSSKNNQGSHWQLDWETSAGKDSFWLTKAWSPESNQNQREPDIFNAMNCYIIQKKTLQPGRILKIDHELARSILNKKLSEIGRSKVIAVLESNLDGGLLRYLKSKAYDPDIEDKVIAEDYADLASVIGMILNDEIIRLRKELMGQNSGNKQKKGSSSFPFKTIADLENEASEAEEQEDNNDLFSVEDIQDDDDFFSGDDSDSNDDVTSISFL